MGTGSVTHDARSLREYITFRFLHTNIDGSWTSQAAEPSAWLRVLKTRKLE